MKESMKDVAAQIRLGHHYLKNGQFNHAALAYERAIQYYIKNHTKDARFHQVLSALPSISAETAGMDGEPQVVDELQSPVHDALVSAYDPESLKGLDYFVGFQCPGTEHWVVAYHARKPLLLDCSVPTVLPNPRVFTLVSNEETGVVEAWLVSDVARAQLSYLLAHRASARVDEVARLYGQHQIMSDRGDNPLHKESQHLHWAIALRPKNAWALARLGETYRRIANGWANYGHSLFDAEARVRMYVRALLYYKEAISLDPDAPGAFWVRAHLGAAIVNVRAFAEVVVDKHRSPALTALLKNWFSGQETEDAFRLFTQDARRWLSEAQQKAGNYYPWAEEYYGATLLFEGMSAKDAEHVSDLLMRGFLHVINSLYLQPSIIENSFEPGELYVSPFLQWGQLALWLGKYDQAWMFTRDGMGRLFKFNFLPGVEALLGFQILVNISFEMIPKCRVAAACQSRVCELLNLEASADVFFGDVEIPARPIAKDQELITFIQKVIEKIGWPTIAPVIPDEIHLNSNLQMSLVHVYYVFKNFYRILDYLGDATGLELASKYMKLINNKLGLRHEPEERLKLSLDSYKQNLLGVMMTGRLTYDMCLDVSNRQPMPRKDY